jgi:hypothetical protein
MEDKIPTKKSEELKEKYAADGRLAPWPPRFSRENWLDALEEQRQSDILHTPKTVQVFPGYDD